MASDIWSQILSGGEKYENELASVPSTRSLVGELQARIRDTNAVQADPFDRPARA